MKKSSLLLGVTYSAIALFGTTPFLTSAADGLFGDYFQRMIGTGPCATGSVLVGFDGTSGSYGTKTCMSLLTLLGSIYTTSAPVGQAMLGFNTDGSLRFGSVNWVRTGNDISYTGTHVGIGTSTPTAKLHVTGGNLLVQTGSVRINQGDIIMDSGYIQMKSTATSPNWGFITEAGLGGIGLAGVETNVNNPDLYVAHNGRTGIGRMTVPRAMLDVNGEIVATNRLTLAQNTGSTSPTWHVDNSSDTFRIFRQPNISTAGTAFVHVNSLGNVGIGTSTPTQKLHITGGSLFVQTGSISVLSGNINLKRGIIALDYDDNGDLGFITEAGLGGIGFAGNQARISRPDLYVTHGGRTGIGGITTPRAMLDVNGEIVATNRLTLAQNTGSTSPTWHVDNSSDTFRIFRQPNISTAGTAFVHVNSLGNVGIGTSIGLARLDVRGIIGNQTTLRVSSSDGSSVSSTWPSGWSGIQTWDILARNTKVDRLQLGNKVILSAVGDAHGNDNWIRMLSVANPNDYSTYGLAAGRLYSAGEVWGREFIYTSDERLKKNIETLTQSENTIMSLRGVRFDWKDSGKQDIGFIAQEVESILPDLVETNSDGYKAVKYGNITAVLVEALKAQIEKNQEQAEKIENLETRLERIEAQIQ